MSPNNWPTVALGELLTKSADFVDIDPTQQYQQITVRLWGKGIIRRGEISGSEIAADRQLKVKSQQFILSRIDARNGAFGLVPDELDGAVVSNDFPVFSFNSQIVPKYLNWMSKTAWFIELCKAASEGTTNRVRLKENKFLATKIPLPPLSEQKHIVARIDELAAKIGEAKNLRNKITNATSSLVVAEFKKLLQEHKDKTKILPFTDYAKLERRPVEIDPEQQYQEIGIYCFGKGIFHKPPRSGFEIGDKKLYQIKNNDLILQVTFAWEGALAVASSQEDGMYGSTRFPTFVSNKEICLPQYLLLYLKTNEGIGQLAKISPGSAGRNRVLSIKRLNEVLIPILPLEFQEYLVEDLESKLAPLKKLQTETEKELNALLPSILDKAFKGEL